MEDQLDELQKAEDEILEILSIAAGTAKELKSLPACDEERLLQLSSRFVELGRSVQRRLLPAGNEPVNDNAGEDGRGKGTSETTTAAPPPLQQDLEAIEALQRLLAAQQQQKS
jgi:hypothetical protein